MQVPKTFHKKRGSVYYLHYFENGVRQRMSLKTSVLQIAPEKQRQFESGRARGATDVFPTETPLEVALTHYIQPMINTRTRRALWTDLCYLRGAFGPVCDALKSAKYGAGRSRGNRATGPTPRIQAQYLEQITTQVPARSRPQVGFSFAIRSSSSTDSRGVGGHPTLARLAL